MVRKSRSKKKNLKKNEKSASSLIGPRIKFREKKKFKPVIHSSSVFVGKKKQHPPIYYTLGLIY
jgi:hypothetical protein